MQGVEPLLTLEAAPRETEKWAAFQRKAEAEVEPEKWNPDKEPGCQARV